MKACARCGFAAGMIALWSVLFGKGYYLMEYLKLRLMIYENKLKEAYKSLINYLKTIYLVECHKARMF